MIFGRRRKCPQRMNSKKYAWPTKREVGMGLGMERRPGINLPALVAIAGTGVFVTALIISTNDLLTFWPLYLVPIVIASITYHLAGAVVVSTFSSVLLALLHWGLKPDLEMLPELIVGMIAFAASGIVIGLQARRSSQHQEVLEATSIFDPITGLFKREYFDRRLAEEVRRALRYNLTLSLLLVQVREFERFKEQFGGYKADLMLNHLGEVLRISTRDTDIIGRHGPSSFVIILPHADESIACAAAKRLHQAVEAAEFEGDALEPSTHCSVSIVAATCPYDGCSPQTLLAKAEEAKEVMCV